MTPLGHPSSRVGSAAIWWVSQKFVTQAAPCLLRAGLDTGCLNSRHSGLEPYPVGIWPLSRVSNPRRRSTETIPQSPKGCKP